MTIPTLLIFFASFILIGLAAVCIFLIFFNKRGLATTDKFISQVSELTPVTFYDVNLRYWRTNGSRTMISPNNRCDLYLFDNCLAIVRRQNFIFKVIFAPVLITPDPSAMENDFNYLDCYKPGYIHFNQFMKGQVDIKVRDQTYRHSKIDITFKGLTSEQIKQLDRIKNWC